MQFAMSPSDVLALADASRRLGGGPIELAGRALGYAPGEGGKIPTWAWYTVALMGGTVMAGWAIYRYGERLFP